MARSTALTVDRDSPPDFSARRRSRTALFASEDEVTFLGLRFTDDHELMELPCTGRLSPGQTVAGASKGVSWGSMLGRDANPANGAWPPKGFFQQSWTILTVRN
jgi:hypothetical protein